MLVGLSGQTLSEINYSEGLVPMHIAIFNDILLIGANSVNGKSVSMDPNSALATISACVTKFKLFDDDGLLADICQSL